MGNILTAIFGAGIVGSLLTMRTYLGIALIVMVGSCTFRGDIVDYIKLSKAQEHEERMIRLNFEMEQFKAREAKQAKEEAEQKTREAKQETDRAKQETDRAKQETTRQKRLAELEDRQHQLVKLSVLSSKQQTDILTAQAEIEKTTKYNQTFSQQLEAAKSQGRMSDVANIQSYINRNKSWIEQQTLISTKAELELNTLKIAITQVQKQIDMLSNNG
jgi:hypothetical protein